MYKMVGKVHGQNGCTDGRSPRWISKTHRHRQTHRDSNPVPVIQKQPGSDSRGEPRSIEPKGDRQRGKPLSSCSCSCSH